MAKAKNDDPAIRIQMTPLIDVTFLILIFLMVLPFKTLERKVAAFLPKDRGWAPTLEKVPDPPKISVVLKPAAASGDTRVKLLDSTVGTGEPAFLTLDASIARIHRESPELIGEINADGEVPHSAVVRTLDAFLKAGVTDVTFVGAPPPRRR